MTKEELIRYGKDYLHVLETACCTISDIHKEFVREAIKALEIVEEFEKAQIITGGRLNGRAFAYKCGLEAGKRKALEQQPYEDEVQKVVDYLLTPKSKSTCEDCVSRKSLLDKLDPLYQEKIKTAPDNMAEGFLQVSNLIKYEPPVTPAQSWIPVSEKVPKDLEPVNITWVNHNPVSYYANIKDKPFTSTGVYFNGQWYWWSATCVDILAEYSDSYDVIDNDIEIIAWQPLPKPYEEKAR